MNRHPSISAHTSALRHARLVQVRRLLLCAPQRHPRTRQPARAHQAAGQQQHQRGEAEQADRERERDVARRPAPRRARGVAGYPLDCAVGERDGAHVLGCQRWLPPRVQPVRWDLEERRHRVRALAVAVVKPEWRLQPHLERAGDPAVKSLKLRAIGGGDAHVLLRRPAHPYREDQPLGQVGARRQPQHVQ
eukprot:scaffold32913_cov69-Phaeocystis_antarctica.AAC.1